jgi:hypothetical protein
MSRLDLDLSDVNLMENALAVDLDGLRWPEV